MGILTPDMKLPSKRSFAKNLGISTITVENAYYLLQSEGYIYSLPKKGFYISNIANRVCETSLPDKKNTLVMDTEPTFNVDFASNQTNPEQFPFSVWAKLMREVISDQSSQLMINSPSAGIYQLRHAICHHLKDFRNMNVSPEQIIVGAGTEYLYGLLIQLLGRNNIYAVENPGYQKITQIYKSNQVSCQSVTLDHNGVCIDSLEAVHADILHISPAHHYPTGIVTPIGRRYELLGWASKETNRYIIEDDYDSEFRFMGKPIPTLQSIDVMEKVIYMNTFTKSLASTIRISYMILPQHLVAEFYNRLNFYSCTVSNFEQYTLTKFIQDGYFEKHINRTRNYYRNLRDQILLEIEKSPLSSIVTISEKDAGLHFLMYVNTNLSDDILVARAKQYGIRIRCLSHYYDSQTANQDHVIVLNYSGISPEHIKDSISRLTKAIID